MNMKRNQRKKSRDLITFAFMFIRQSFFIGAIVIWVYFLLMQIYFQTYEFTSFCFQLSNCIPRDHQSLVRTFEIFIINQNNVIHYPLTKSSLARIDQIYQILFPEPHLQSIFVIICEHFWLLIKLLSSISPTCSVPFSAILEIRMYDVSYHSCHQIYKRAVFTYFTLTSNSRR